MSGGGGSEPPATEAELERLWLVLTRTPSSGDDESGSPPAAGRWTAELDPELDSTLEDLRVRAQALGADQADARSRLAQRIEGVAELCEAWQACAQWMRHAERAAAKALAPTLESPGSLEPGPEPELGPAPEPEPSAAADAVAAAGTGRAAEAEAAERAAYEALGKLAVSWDAMLSEAASAGAGKLPLVATLEARREQLLALRSEAEGVLAAFNASHEKSRVAFPRFYCLYDDELLEIKLAGSAQGVIPHLRKLFAAIKDLRLDGPDGHTATAMISPETVCVEFEQPLALEARRSEDWLPELEKLMRESLKRMQQETFAANATVPYQEWVLQGSRCGEMVILVSALAHTSALDDGAEDMYSRLQARRQEVLAQIETLCALARKNLTQIQRDSIGALSVLAVHWRDEVVQLLAVSGTQRIDVRESFERQAQLKYQLGSDTEGADDAPNATAHARVLNFCQPYGCALHLLLPPFFCFSRSFPVSRLTNHWRSKGITTKNTWFALDADEFLGNSFRLVITPMTDRCYLVCTQAMSMGAFAAPNGPAGTGKTETVKDLAKALGRQAVVFNCSGGLDARAFAKFFKGLSACGGWGIFDEFNRLKLETLAAVSVQLQHLCAAVRQCTTQRSAGTFEFDFEGQTIRMLPTFWVAITMNPGYGDVLWSRTN